MFLLYNFLNIILLVWILFLIFIFWTCINKRTLWTFNISIIHIDISLISCIMLTLKISSCWFLWLFFLYFKILIQFYIWSIFILFILIFNKWTYSFLNCIIKKMLAIYIFFWSFFLIWKLVINIIIFFILQYFSKTWKFGLLLKTILVWIKIKLLIID